MSLVPMDFSDAMVRDYTSVINHGALWVMGTPVPFIRTFHTFFAKNYNDYARGGEVKGAIVKSEPFFNQGGEYSILETYFESLITGDNVRQFAQKLAEYWNTVSLVPGPPMHGGIQTVKVVNDALQQVDAFEAAIRASMMNTAANPWYLNFVTNVQTIGVAAVTWTVTELIPTPGGPVPTPFLEKIT